MKKYYYKKDEVCPITSSVKIGSYICRNQCASCPTLESDTKGNYIYCLVTTDKIEKLSKK